MPLFLSNLNCWTSVWIICPFRNQKRWQVESSSIPLFLFSCSLEVSCLFGGFLILSLVVLSLLHSLPPLPSSSSSLWKGCPLSFRTASVKLSAAQEGTNRCPSLSSYMSSFSVFPPTFDSSFLYSFCCYCVLNMSSLFYHLSFSVFLSVF